MARKQTRKPWKLLAAAGAGAGLVLLAVPNVPDARRYLKIRKM